MKMMPPPIIAETKIARTMLPGSRYCTYGTYGIDLDDRQRRRGRDARRGQRVDCSGRSMPPSVPSSVADGELVGVVLDQRQARVGAGQHLAREVRRDVQHAADLAVAQVVRAPPPGRCRRSVSNGARVGRHRLEHLLQLHRRHAVVLVDDADLEVLHLAAEGVAQHDELHHRHDHRDDDQSWGCAGSGAGRVR